MRLGLPVFGLPMITGMYYHKTLEKLGYSVLMLGDYDTEKDDSITPFLNRVYAENTMPIQGN